MTTVPHGLVGVVHLPALPGDPRNVGGGFAAVERAALADARAYLDGGIRAVVVENFGSAPFVKGTEGSRLAAFDVACMTQIVRACRELGLIVGVNCLRNDARSALDVAAAASATFVRINVHVGAYATDQGVIEGEAAATLRRRRELEATHVALLCDVRVKHARPLVDRPIADEVHDLVDRGLADAVIVTGAATGDAADRARIDAVLGASRGRPVFLGSGLDRSNAAQLLPGCAGAIVGSSLKQGGDVHAPVDVTRVAALVDATRGLFDRSTDA